MSFVPEGGYYTADTEADWLFPYRWALDKLVQAFGFENIRVKIPHDFGRSYYVGVVNPTTLEGRILPLRLAQRDDIDQPGFDLNKNKLALDSFIDDVKARKIV